MKKNDWILLFSVFAYSYLFYEQGPGINFLIFNCCLIGLLSFRDKHVHKNKQWLLAVIGTLISSICISVYGNGLSVAANIISLCLVSAFSIHPQTSVITSLGFTAFSIGTSVFFMAFDAVKRLVNYNIGFKIGHNILLYIIPFFVVALFFFMYKISNPLFDNFTGKINFDFIVPDYLLFTISGLILMYGFFYHRHIGIIARIDESVPNILTPENHGSLLINFLKLDIEKEKRSGLILFGMLNVLLLSVNVLDIIFMWFDRTLPKDLSYSDFVHQGTAMLIVSIIIAILIIMFYFRGALNFHQNNKQLKLLVYVWIAQNMFMILSTAFRNQLYINEYSLTYKRIGVYVWLILALLGLITTFIKIYKAKSNWYLFRTNAWLFYGVLVLSCLINWDVMVTEFNIKRAMQNNKTVDRMYLLSLSDKNLPQLFLLDESIKNEAHNESSLDSSFESGRDVADTYDKDYYKHQLNEKSTDFLLRKRVNGWQSWNYYDNKVYQQMAKLYLDGKVNEWPLHNKTENETDHKNN